MSFEQEGPQKQLISHLASTWLLIKNRAKRMLCDMKHDLTFEQMMILHILANEEGQNLGSMAEQADREQTTISRMVDGLEKRNLVLRVSDKSDKRQKLLYLTPLGKERMVQMKPFREQFYSVIYKDISEKEICLCLATLEKMFRNLEKR